MGTFDAVNQQAAATCAILSKPSLLVRQRHLLHRLWDWQFREKKASLRAKLEGVQVIVEGEWLLAELECTDFFG